MEKPICLNLKDYDSFDNLESVNAHIKKLHDTHVQNITVLSKEPQYFKDNPFVDKSFKEASVNMPYFLANYAMHDYVHDGKKKLLIIVPHLSTGGLPQVTLNKIELLKDEFEIKLVEYAILALIFNIQRNKILSLLEEKNFHTLNNDKHELFNIIDRFNPDVIGVEEFPEMFMDNDVTNKLYKSDRKYKIIETTHDSSFNPKNKRYLPDQYIFVSAYNSFKYIDSLVPFQVIEYPVNHKERNQHALREKIGLEHDYKHVVIVGLFTERKNQAYAFEMAKKLTDYKIKFHFLGNQADNFKYYWEPLLTNKPENCILWGERSDVSDFVAACDVFLFPSKGDRGNKELNPIAIKEALEYDVIKMMYNLDVYCNKYDEYKDVVYLTGDISSDTNNMISFLNFNNINEELIVIGTYPNTDKRVKLTKECIESLKPSGRKIILVSHYPIDQELQKMVDYYVYDKHNPTTTHSYYTLFYNRPADYDVEININQLANGNQSLAVLTNVFNAFKHAKQHGFKRLFYVTFDVIIDPRDIAAIDESFNVIANGKKAYLAKFNSSFDYGVQTNGMSFDVDYFLENFDDVRDVENYNRICKEIGAQNFLEDYLAKKVDRLDKSEIYLRPMKNNANDETFLEHSGTGVSSHSEYYSILPIQDKPNYFMLYFYTYNLDSRIIDISIGDSKYKLDISKNREFKKEFKYTGEEIEVCLEFYDGLKLIKKDSYIMNNSNINKYLHTGHFIYKNVKPKIKLVHIITPNDERARLSQESLERVKDFGWEYVVQVNELFKSLPPAHNCTRPDCVSLEQFNAEQIQEFGTALTPGHYGCYEAHKNAILTEFNDCDFLMICEADCIIEGDIHNFVRKVEECTHLLGPNNIGYMSFGDKSTLDTAILQSPVVQDINNDMYITDHIICTQSVMFPKSISSWLKGQARTHKWDTIDVYYNILFKNSPYKMAIIKDRLTTQSDGFSLIDKNNKTYLKK